MTYLYLYLTGLSTGIFVGMLLARKHPSWANTLAHWATFGRDRASDIYKGLRG